MRLVLLCSETLVIEMRTVASRRTHFYAKPAQSGDHRQVAAAPSVSTARVPRIPTPVDSNSILAYVFRFPDSMLTGQ